MGSMKDAFSVTCKFEKYQIGEDKAWTCINATKYDFMDRVKVSVGCSEREEEAVEDMRRFFALQNAVLRDSFLSLHRTQITCTSPLMTLKFGP